MKLKEFAFAPIVAAIAFTSLTTSSAFSQQAEIANGVTQKVDAHGACRMVKNAAGAKVMVPLKSASEWSSGNNAFLQNVTAMQGISVSACSSPPANCSSTREPKWGAYLDGNARNVEYYWDQIWDWYWGGVRIFRTSDMMAVPNVDDYNYNVTYGYYTGDDDASAYPVWRQKKTDNCTPTLDSPDRLKFSNVASTACIDRQNLGRCRGQNSYGTNLNFDTQAMRIYNVNTKEALCLLQSGGEADLTISAGNPTHLGSDGKTLIYTGVINYSNLNEWLADFDSVLDRVGIFMPPGLDTCHVQSFAYLGTQWTNYVQFTHTFRRGTNGV